MSYLCPLQGQALHPKGRGQDKLFDGANVYILKVDRHRTVWGTYRASSSTIFSQSKCLTIHGQSYPTGFLHSPKYSRPHHHSGSGSRNMLQTRSILPQRRARFRYYSLLRACKNKGKQGRENKKRCLLRSVYNLIQNATSPYTQLRLGPRLLEETPSIATVKQGYASMRQ